MKTQQVTENTFDTELYNMEKITLFTNNLKDAHILDLSLLTTEIISRGELNKLKIILRNKSKNILSTLQIIESCIRFKQMEILEYLQKNKINLSYNIEEVIYRLSQHDDKYISEFFFTNFNLTNDDYCLAMIEAISLQDKEIIRLLWLLERDELIKKITINGEYLIGLSRCYIIYLLLNGISLFSNEDLDLILRRLDMTPTFFLSNFSDELYKIYSLELMK